MTDIKVVKNLKILAEEIALGSGSSVIGDKGVAIGYNATVRVDKSFNIVGLPMIRSDTGEDDIVQNFGGSLAVLLWKEQNPKTVADYTYTLPSGGLFFPVEVGVIVTVATSVSGQPTLRFGWSGSLAGYLGAVAASGPTAAGSVRIDVVTQYNEVWKSPLSAT